MKLYQSVPGIGVNTSIALVCYLPELGHLEHKQISALTGLAPFNHDSGKKKGKRAIYGGRKPVRNILYMAALSAIQFNQDAKKTYKSLRDKGKPAKVALVAVMRKLITTLNSIARRGTPWTPKECCVSSLS